MKVVAYSELKRDDWNRTCEASSQAWLFHRREWIEIEEKFFFARNYSFAIADGNCIAGVHPLYAADIPLTTGGKESLLHSGIHRHTGLALSPSLSSAETKAARSAAMHHIFDLAERLDADRIQLNSHNLAPENRSANRQEIPFWVEHHGFHLGLNFGPGGFVAAPGMSTCNADQLVELTGDPEHLFSALDESCRRAIRKAQKSGLRAKEGTNDLCVADYYQLAERSAERTGEALPPIDYYYDIWRRLRSTGHCAVLFAEIDSSPAAALILVIDKGAANFLAGVSDPQFLALRVNDFLHWSAIVWALGSGLSCYRLGPIFPEVPRDWPIARVSRFKGKFGGRSRTIIQGSYFRHAEKYSAAARECIARLSEQSAQTA